MKIILFASGIALLLAACRPLQPSQALKINEQADRYSMSDTVPVFEFAGRKTTQLQTLMYFNGVQVDEVFTWCFPHNMIDSVVVKKGSITIGQTEYNGQVIMKGKVGYQPAFISLEDLVHKYTGLESFPDIIIIDDHYITADFASSLVDEKFVLKIVLSELENASNERHYTILRLIPRTEENIREANHIFIRGTDPS